MGGDTGQTKVLHPAVFLVMYLPFGICTGYFSVTLGYLLSHAGVSTGAIAVLIATVTWLQVFKLVWAPLVDSVLTYRGIYVLASLTLSLCLAGTGLVHAGPQTMPVLRLLAMLGGVAMGLMGITTNGLMAGATPPAQRGRVGGWSQVGNLGGTGVGGGLGLWIATHTNVAWASAATLAAICVVCTCAVLFVPEPVHSHRQPQIIGTLRNLGGEVWRLARSRVGALGLLIMMLPFGTGSAGKLWSAVSGDWGASGDMVALVTGGISGLAAGAGCLIGGYLCDAIDRRTGYLLAGALMAACTLTMLAAPKTPASFVSLTLLYALIGGMAYAACYAVVLEAAGTVAAASKCDLLISISNLPIAAMTTIDGAAQTRWGSDGMLLTESLVGLGAVLLFAVVAAATRTRADGGVGPTAVKGAVLF
jgi:MFS family permease